MEYVGDYIDEFIDCDQDIDNIDWGEEVNESGIEISRYPLTPDECYLETDKLFEL